MSSKDGKHNNSDDTALFRATVGDVAPVQTRKRHTGTASKPTPKARQRRDDERRALAESLSDVPNGVDVATGQEMRFCRPGVGQTTLRKLRRGRIAVQGEIDLHGLTRAQAHAQLRDFLAFALGKGLRCIRVVHGKGLGSGDRGPVLKNAVNSWLRKWDAVLAFCSAPDSDGGTGAVYVLLKSKR